MIQSLWFLGHTVGQPYYFAPSYLDVAGISQNVAVKSHFLTCPSYKVSPVFGPENDLYESSSWFTFVGAWVPAHGRPKYVLTVVMWFFYITAPAHSDNVGLLYFHYECFLGLKRRSRAASKNPCWDTWFLNSRPVFWKARIPSKTQILEIFRVFGVLGDFTKSDGFHAFHGFWMFRVL